MSNLSFTNTEIIRKQLLIRNLSDSYGYSATLPKNFTDGDYSVQNTSNLSVTPQLDVVEVGSGIQPAVSGLNIYGPEEYAFHSVSSVINGLGTTLNYFDSFTISSNVGGLISIVSDGAETAEGDSTMVRIARAELQGLVLETMGVKLKSSTLGRINVLEAFSNPDTAMGLLTGREPLIERDYQITVPGSPITRAAEYIGRVSGVELPVSYIPGEFFESNVEKGGVEKFIDKAKELTGKILNLDFSSGKKTYSQKLLQYTSGGQKSRLFKSVNYNKYQPNFDSSTDGVVNKAIGFVQGLIGLDPPDGKFYIGSDTVDPGTLFTFDSKSTSEKGYMVSGPSRMVKEFEGITPLNTYPENGRNYLNGTSPLNVETQFVWIGGLDEVRGEINGVGVQSNEKTLPPNGILSKTQDIIDDAEKLTGNEKLSHPGHIISNVSHKYYDGYKEISKGNAVRNEDDEFCRVWTKDHGYDRFGRLVRHKGIQTTGRVVPGSVISDQMNLNIGPTKDENGKPLNFGFDKDSGKNKTKYMFSIENLAWAGSSKIKERPLCEQGPNDGRIMWFPPYDLKYTDDNRANWTSHTFLGRPEPIYTYNNSERTGTLSFKVVVDHPSIFNLIRRENSKNVSNVKKQELIDAFVAGCKDYDIYDLATKFTTLDYKELVSLEQFLTANTSGTLKSDTSDTTTSKSPDVVNTTIIVPEFGKQPKKLQLYWFNDVPGPNNATTVIPNSEFENDLDEYLSLFTGGDYQEKALKIIDSDLDNVMWGDTDIAIGDGLSEFKSKLESIKNSTVELKTSVTKTLAQNELFKFVITIKATTSEVASQSYNNALAKRRAESLKKYLLDDGKYDEKRITIESVETIGENPDFTGFKCNEPQDNKNDGVDERIYSKSATYCRTATATISVIGDPTEKEIVVGQTIKNTDYNKKFSEVSTTDDFSPIDLLLKTMHSECDYFRLLKEEDPIVHDNLMDKLKYFQPAFHSTTPEGLNKRLTFLQQCLRPGETIKVYDEGGEEVPGISSNTSFGKPPISVLRIGDFYHSKIVIDNVNISYDENLMDMNPEGIGMQPMIASVNMGIKFIGGQGISNVIDELQNALSFNYYANTEVYDDMATKTEGGRDSEKMDKLAKSINKNITDSFVETLNDPEVSKDEDQFWGNLVGDEDSDLIQYNQFYNEFAEDVNSYVNTLTNEVETLYDTHGYTAVSTVLNPNGKFWTKTIVSVSPSDEVEIPFMGRTTDDYNVLYTNLMKKVLEYVDFVEDEDFYHMSLNPIYVSIRNKGFNFNDKRKEELQSILYDFTGKVDEYFKDFGSSLNDIVEKVRESQTKLQKSLDILNIILGSEIDGYIKGIPKETTVKYLNNLTVNNGDLGGDVKKVLNSLSEYNEFMLGGFEDNVTFKDVSENYNESVEFFYLNMVPKFLIDDIFDINIEILNNPEYKDFNQDLVRKICDELEIMITDEIEFETPFMVWDKLGPTTVIYDYKMTETTDPGNATKIEDFYNANSNPQNELSDFSWVKVNTNHTNN